MNIRGAGFGFVAAAILSVAGAAIVQSSVFAQDGSAPRPSQPGSAPKPSEAQDTAARMPDLIAVNFYADWCGKCQAMKPAVADTEKRIAGKPVLRVTLDQTDRESPQAEYLLAALGLGELWKEHAGKTGFILLVDPETRRVVGRVTSDMDAAAMVRSIDRAIES